MKNLEVVECKESLGRVYAILVDPENGRYVLAKGYDVLTGEWQETTGLLDRSSMRPNGSSG